MTPRVTINGRFLTRPPTGVDRVAFELLRAALPRLGVHLLLRAVVPRASVAYRGPDLGLELEPLGAFAGHIWEQVDLPRLCRDELLLNLCNTGPVSHDWQLIMLHDASVLANPRTFGVAFRRWYSWLFARLMKRARVVATVSKFSADELQRYLGRRPRGIEVIYPGGEHILRAASDRAVLGRLGLIGRRYVLGVGTLTANKNFGNLAKAALLLRDREIRLVAVGGKNARIYAKTDVPMGNCVLAGYVTDGELRALYEGAECFVFPSLYEGFGLPPLEAMHCGCPVVVSDRASLPEVCGPAAMYCDPESPTHIAAQMERLCQSESLRMEMRQAGQERVLRYSWSKAAEQLNDIIAAQMRMAA